MRTVYVNSVKVKTLISLLVIKTENSSKIDEIERQQVKNKLCIRRYIMVDFFSAALPWIGMGLAVAIFIVYQDAKKKKIEKTDDNSN